MNSTMEKLLWVVLAFLGTAIRTLLFVFAFLLATSKCAHADEMLLDINLHAHHWDRDVVDSRNLNENNFGVGLEFKNNDFRKLFGVYQNSERKISTYALAAWTPIKKGPVELGAFGGLVTGYAKSVQVAAGLFSAVELTNKVNLNITAVPTVKKINCFGFVAFQLAFKF
jgi:hypothetical protein